MLSSPGVVFSNETKNNLRQPFGPVKLVVIQPTTFCNLDCDYCYLPSRNLKRRLSLDLLEPIFHNLFASPYVKEDFTVVWHAGEPLAMPIKFYKSAFEIINDLSNKFNLNNYSFLHSIQTNATLINQNWCDFFKDYQVKIGVSLDGPAFLHDKNRKTRTGLGTHATTMRGVSYLQKNNIDFSVIAVLTKESLDYPDEIFQFFIENQITRVGFNVEETEGMNHSSTLEAEGTDIKYRNFMQRFYELTKLSGPSIKVREFERIKQSICQDTAIEFGQFTPYTIISIDHEGNFMTFSPELLSLNSSEYGKFILGNVMHDSFESAIQTEKFRRINNDIQAGVESCQKNCQYFSVCGGGAPANKYFENGSFNSNETMYCRYTQKILTDIILKDIEQSLGLV